ncbi:cytochrome P450 family protein [Euzebya tangerina]|uniref:cytochrome P450 family protein n=1 Tax=Euzebya tangerina TaxID=591198 RepID=UPI000E316E75|nr:cytochrome P450 [Euzebya tangerina]
MTQDLPRIDPSGVDITASTFKADPFPFYAQLRQTAPVAQVNAGKRMGSAWILTRYDDVTALLRDDRFAKNPADAMTRAQYRRAPKIPGGPFKPLQTGLLSVDPPDHTRLRRLVSSAFTPRMIEELREDVQVLADQLLDAALRKDTIDLIADYATPLPLIVIGRMLGVPESDATRFHRWWQTFVTAGDGGSSALRVVPTLLRMLRFMRRLVKERTRSPKDDLVSALAVAHQDGDRLSEDEVVAMIFLLLSAGHETTVNLLGSGTLALLQHPEQLALLRDDPSVGTTAVEELLRFVAPVETATERYALGDVTLHDVTIPRGELVLGVIASANRDPAHFTDPDTLDLRRSPNPHLAFGKGIHYCVGAPLARMEGAIGLQTLLRRAPEIRLAVPPEQLRWRSSFLVRGLESLPVTLAGGR